MDKKARRQRRATRSRARIAPGGKNRLSVHRTPRHIYAQILAPEGGKVRIWVKPNAGNVELHIADSGIGIPEADVPHIFDPFGSGASRSSRIHLGRLP